MSNFPARLFAALLCATAICGCGGDEKTAKTVAKTTEPAVDSPAPTPEQTPKQAVTAMVEGLRKHQPQAVWDALPVGFRDDIDGLVHDAALRMDPEVWNNTFDAASKLVLVLDGKRAEILAHPQLRKLQGSGLARLAKQWQGLAKLLRIVVSSEARDLGKLQKLDVRGFLATTGSELLRELSSLADEFNQPSLAGIFSDLEPKVLDQDATTARIGWVVEEGQQPVSEFFLAKVDDRWIPAGWADAWEKVKTTRAQLSKRKQKLFSDNKSARLKSIAALNAMVDELQAAPNQQALHAVLDQHVSPQQWEQILPVLRVLAGEQSPNGFVTPLQPAVPPVTGSVVVHIEGKVTAAKEDEIYKSLQAMSSGDVELLPGDRGGLVATINGVSDVVSFAKSIPFGTVEQSDPELRKITVKLK